MAFTWSMADDSDMPESVTQDSAITGAASPDELVRKLDDCGRRDADPLIKTLAEWREKSDRKDLMYA